MEATRSIQCELLSRHKWRKRINDSGLKFKRKFRFVANFNANLSCTLAVPSQSKIAATIAGSVGSSPCMNVRQTRTILKFKRFRLNLTVWNWEFYGFTFQFPARSEQSRDPRTCMMDSWWARWRWWASPMDEGGWQWDVRAGLEWFVPGKLQV